MICTYTFASLFKFKKLRKNEEAFIICFTFIFILLQVWS